MSMFYCRVLNSPVVRYTETLLFDSEEWHVKLVPKKLITEHCKTKLNSLSPVSFTKIALPLKFERSLGYTLESDVHTKPPLPGKPLHIIVMLERGILLIIDGLGSTLTPLRRTTSSIERNIIRINSLNYNNL